MIDFLFVCEYNRVCIQLSMHHLCVCLRIQSLLYIWKYMGIKTTLMQTLRDWTDIWSWAGFQLWCLITGGDIQGHPSVCLLLYQSYVELIVLHSLIWRNFILMQHYKDHQSELLFLDKFYPLQANKNHQLTCLNKEEKKLGRNSGRHRRKIQNITQKGYNLTQNFLDSC